MALSLSNRRHAQTSTLIHLPATHRPQLVRKQHSFIDTGVRSGTPHGFLTRTPSVGRSYDNLRHNLLASVRRQKHTNTRNNLHLPKQRSVDQGQGIHTKNAQAANSRTNHCVNNKLESSKKGYANSVGTKFKDNRSTITAWSSTSSILKSLDDELANISIGASDKNLISSRRNNTIISSCNSNCGNGSKEILQSNDDLQPSKSNVNTKLPPTSLSPKTDVNKINLSIVLSQTIKATTDNEIGHNSDVDSSSEGIADIVSDPLVTSSSTKYIKSQQQQNTPIANNCTAPNRRAAFQSSRCTAVATSVTSTATNLTPTTITQQNNLNALPSSLVVKQRPPLVRAMSAPVRTLNENLKNNVFASNNKRKAKQRKLNSRNISCARTIGTDDFTDTKSSVTIPNWNSRNDNGKKVVTRLRNCNTAPDVITLVSLLSSEGSDSEKEDTSATTDNVTNSDSSSNGRAPFLKKTGKSVSFQEHHYTPQFQLASKEYSHMIRRGSIAPIATRVNANRPSTVPTSVSLYSSDEISVQNRTNLLMLSQINETCYNGRVLCTSTNQDDLKMSNSSEKEMNSSVLKGNTDDDLSNAEEYTYPLYVRSIKERECWKLYQKMIAKGINVSYDTILRGMLTPTEFRQLQKQREAEEAKIRETEEDENKETITSATKVSTTIEEFLSETIEK